MAIPRMPPMTDITGITAITSITSCATDLFTLISRDTPLRRTAATNGGEYSAPCPLCRRGHDHFKYWRGTAPGAERWACLGPKAGRSGCDKGGDAIQYLRDRDHLTYPQALARLGIAPTAPRSAGVLACIPAAPPAGPRAPSPLTPPPPLWQTRATQFSARSALLLWEDEGARALAYLRARGIQDATLRAFHVGYNPEDLHDDPAAWGLPPPTRSSPPNLAPPRHHLPLVRRRSARAWDLAPQHPPPAQPRANRPRRAQVLGPGFANALYNAGALGPDPAHALPAVLVEGELDALTIVQAAGDLVAAVATGSTAGARCLQWMPARPGPASSSPSTSTPPVAPPAPATPAWWLDALPRALRWRPLLHDVNSAPRARRRPRLDPVRPKPLIESEPLTMPAKPRKSSCRSSHYTRRDGTIDSFHHRATRSPRFPLMNQLSERQVAQFQSLAAIYRADLLDPGAWEALLLLLEICNILDLLPTVIERIFGEGIRARVETWSGGIHPRCPQSPPAGAAPPCVGLAPPRTPPAPLSHRRRRYHLAARLRPTVAP